MKRPGGLAVRAGGAAVIGVVAVVIAGWSPGVVGVLAGVLTIPPALSSTETVKVDSARPAVVPCGWAEKTSLFREVASAL